MAQSNVNIKDKGEGEELVNKLVHINRVAKVVKGGRRFGFAALVVVGDQKGRVGYGSGKAKEVPEAVRKATETAKRNLMRVPLREGRTLHHDVEGVHGAGHVVLRSAPPGTGVIAGGPIRALFMSLGIQDVVVKSVRSSNPYNMIHATLKALGKQESPRDIAARRGKKPSEIIRRRTGKGLSSPLEKTISKKESLEKESTEKQNLETENLETENPEKQNLETESLKKESLEKESTEKQNLETENLEKTISEKAMKEVDFARANAKEDSKKG